MKQTDQLGAMRHTAEHVLHQAMEKLYPGIHAAMGPATTEGFYMDFDPNDKVKLSEADFPKIEAEMAKVIKADYPMKNEVISIEEAKKLFKDNPYKQEWLDEISAKKEKPSVYRTGDKFVDLCSGPHAQSTGEIKAFKLLSVAGAYWHGDEKNKMLTRIYGTAFFSQKELDEYLTKLELAKKNDHRKLGKLLELFTVSDQVGQGLILWMPKGNIIKEEIESWAKKTESDWGYQRVTTPNIGKADLYHTSGHLPYYAKDMYPPMQLEDGGEYRLKPMNCPHHHQIFAAKPRSYKDLPLRLAEYGTCYRYEASGELFGLMRVRGFSQNDAHIYCTDSQAVDEFVSVMKLHEYFYKTLGITNYHLELALRDPKDKTKYHGDDAMWEKAEDLMRQAVKQVNIPMVTQIGNAAFYGPKIDFIIESSIGREFAISTNQIDLFMGTRFGLKYIDSDGKERTPVIIHRAPLGSHERFIGFLIEHFGGAFPVWLAPIQAMLIPISQKHSEFATGLMKQFKQLNLRVELDNRSESMGSRIRDAATQKVPYIIIVGDKEISAGKLAIRQRGGEDLGQMTIDQFTDRIQSEIKEKII